MDGKRIIEVNLTLSDTAARDWTLAVLTVLGQKESRGQTAPAGTKDD